MIHLARPSRTLRSLAGTIALVTAAAGASVAERPAAQHELERLNPLIGEWRGVAQPQRGSNRGAWQQTAQWVWNFDDDAPAIDHVVTGGRLIRSARLTFDSESGLYRFRVTDPAGRVRTAQGRLTDNHLVLESVPGDDGDVTRITITLLSGDRTLVLHERRPAGQQRFLRIAEVGYTRSGVRLARSGAGQPECIVTGGAGTIEVTYQGKTYYVCCSGCKQAFDADPAGIIAEAAERRKREQAR